MTRLWKAAKCYEVCRKFGKPVIVMEPVKGGNLVNLPENAKAVFEELQAAVPPATRSVLPPDLRESEWCFPA